MGLFLNLPSLHSGGLNFNFVLLVSGAVGSSGTNQCLCFGCLEAFLAKLRQSCSLLTSSVSNFDSLRSPLQLLQLHPSAICKKDFCTLSISYTSSLVNQTFHTGAPNSRTLLTCLLQISVRSCGPIFQARDLHIILHLIKDWSEFSENMRRLWLQI